MLKNIPVWALLWLTPPAACFSQTCNEGADSLSVIELQEVVVKVKPVISKIDGNSYIPTGVQKRTAVSGLDLLSKMQLPGITVNPLTAAITAAGSANVQLRINGAEASSSEIAALRPNDILRIEHHDTPGARYADADAVIDFITIARSSGGNISAEGMNAVGSGKWAAFDNIAATYNHGPSSLAFNAGLFGMQRDNWVRDYEETWHYPHESVTRTETGQPVEIGMRAVVATLGYTLRRDQRYLLNIKGSFNLNHVPAKEEGDRHTMLVTSNSTTPTEITEHTRETSLNPSLGVFYRLFINRSQSVTANITGSYIGSSALHTYREETAGVGGADIVSDVTGRKFALFAEAYYQIRAANFNITAGARHSQSRADNDYTGSETARVIVNRAESSAFGELNFNTGAFNLLANLTASRLSTSQNSLSRQKFAVNPGFGADWEPSNRLRLRYNMNLTHRQPPIADMSDVVQTVQPGMVKRGNPSLRSFRVIDQKLSASFYHPIVSADLLIDYRHEKNPVMTSTSFSRNRFVITPENQVSFQELRSELCLTLRPWADHLSIALSPSLSRYFSHGNNYRHERGIFHLGVNIDFNYGNFTFNGSLMTGAANSMYGEEIISEKDMNMLLVGYKQPRWSIQAGVFNIFMNRYSMTTENLSALTPYISTAHCNKNAYAVVKFSVNVDFGRKTGHSDAPKQFDAAPDTDSGIMNSLK